MSTLPGPPRCNHHRDDDSKDDVHDDNDRLAFCKSLGVAKFKNLNGHNSQKKAVRPSGSDFPPGSGSHEIESPEHNEPTPS